MAPYFCLLWIQVEHLLNVGEALDVALSGGGNLPILQQTVALKTK
jgi:hypothetical protein